jgi:hypothetical protein
MGNAKPWQIILVLASLLVFGYSVWKFGFSGGPDLPDAVLLVDVKTGNLFEIDISGRKAAAYPEKHPDTGEYTLMPIEKNEDGSWKIASRMMVVLEGIEGEMPAVLDRSTGRVQVVEGRTRRMKP